MVLGDFAELYDGEEMVEDHGSSAQTQPEVEDVAGFNIAWSASVPNVEDGIDFDDEGNP